MSVQRPTTTDLETHFAIEQFLHYEARLLDNRQFDDWLELFADDVHYWMPLRSNRTSRELELETGGQDDLATFDDDFTSLRQRVFRLGTGVAWAENPPSRTRHLITNIWARAAETDGEYDVSSSFLLYRSRGDDVVDTLVGHRDDILRAGGAAGFQIARRTILLDQATILATNLSMFF